MERDDTLQRVSLRLKAAGVPFMVTGSFSSGVHGEWRTTQDLDLVIDPTHAQLSAFLAALGDEYYAESSAAQDAMRRRSMFNVIDLTTGWKIDLIFRKMTAYDLQAFNRKKPMELGGVEAPVSSPEDVILSKLQWHKISTSDRQLRDALGVAVVQWGRLDMDYLYQWAKELGVEEVLRDIMEQAGELQEDGV